MPRASRFLSKKSLLPLAGLAAIATLSASGVACSSSTNTGNGFDNGNGNGNGNGTGSNGAFTGGEGGSGGFGGGGDGGSGADVSGQDDCPPEATLVYVTGEGSKLYSFYPPDQTFTLIGTFDCLSSPTHMTVDRQAVAWVVADGQIYKASTKDASCSAVSSWKTDLSFADFSLTFIGTSNAIDNTIYLLNGTGNLSSFDIPSGVRTPVNSVVGSMTFGDMTSNGDGTLYFLNDISTPVLYNIDPMSGKTISSSSLSASGGGSQALAFWGGSFYAFESDSIYQFDPMQQTTKPLGKAPLQVTGAGQSTCVPKTPPPPK